MNTEILWSRPAVRDIKKLEKETAKRIHEALLRVVNERHGDVKKLRGREDEWRLRVGDWRVLFKGSPHSQRIVIRRVLHRSDAY